MGFRRCFASGTTKDAMMADADKVSARAAAEATARAAAMHLRGITVIDTHAERWRYRVRINLGVGEGQKHIGRAYTLREAVDMYNAEATKHGIALHTYPEDYVEPSWQQTTTSAAPELDYVEPSPSREQTTTASPGGVGPGTFVSRAGPSDGSSLPRYVRQVDSGRYQCRMGGSTRKHLGTFDSIRECVDAYNVAAAAMGLPPHPLTPEQATTLDEGGTTSASASASAPPTSKSPAIKAASGKKKGVVVVKAPPAAASSKQQRVSLSLSHKTPTPTPTTAVAEKVDVAVQAAHASLEPEALLGVVMDMRTPGKWYPLARSMKRDIHVHVGPTNSGKTYNALQRLKGADSGVYCAPLRLLAWEVADVLNKKEGVKCDMITGQEKATTKGAQHTACTVEMADVSRPRDVAVIDEAHLMSDPHRGAAFTRAIIGLPARELHLCGDPAMVKLVERVAAELGDDLTVHRYERLQPLRVLRKTFDDVKHVESGDCLVAFSRRDVHRLKTEVEVRAKKRVCVIYGGLPPEARSRQAELFNNREETGYGVLIATDAIGMGLNLSIKRVIFTTMRKFAGPDVGMRLLEPPEVKQIAGRAGRDGMGRTAAVCMYTAIAHAAWSQ